MYHRLTLTYQDNLPNNRVRTRMAYQVTKNTKLEIEQTLIRYMVDLLSEDINILMEDPSYTQEDAAPYVEALKPIVDANINHMDAYNHVMQLYRLFEIGVSIDTTDVWVIDEAEGANGSKDVRNTLMKGGFVHEPTEEGNTTGG